MRRVARDTLKVGLSLLLHPAQTRATLRAAKNLSLQERREHLRAAADWLLLSQRRAPHGAGFSRRFSLIRGWDRCYVETTGYIIPSLLDAAVYLRESKYRESAMVAGAWLTSVQREDGAFCEIDHGTPQVFDTGQVLIGLNRMLLETSDERYLLSASRAAKWLVDTQDGDGAWRRNAYNGLPHAYYSRVAAALLELGHRIGNETFVNAAVANLEWVLAQEQGNGYFRHSEFRVDEPALLHTLVYVVEGFVMAHSVTGEERWRDAALRATTTLSAKLDADGLLRSQYHSDWSVANDEYCVTGLAQFAGVCFDVARICSKPSFGALGARVLDQLCRWQLPVGADVHGALPSSVPVWGYYGGMEFYNWNNKFFVDALLKEAAAADADQRGSQRF